MLAAAMAETTANVIRSPFEVVKYKIEKYLLNFLTCNNNKLDSIKILDKR